MGELVKFRLAEFRVKCPDNEKRKLPKFDGLAHCYSNLSATDLHLADAVGFVS